MTTTDLVPQDATEQDIAVADREHTATALAHILATGDLSKLSNEQRVAFYLQRCQSLGLNPYSRPFDWLILDGKLVLYENRSCAEQLRRQHQISILVTRRDVIGGDTKEPMFVVEVQGRRPNGQTDQSSKYVPLTDSKGRLTGRNLANAYAKCETGAKRRLTFSMIGMAAPPDPDELKGARPVIVDGTGRVLDNPTDEQKALAADPGMARVIGEPTFENPAGRARGAVVVPPGQQPNETHGDPWPDVSNAFDGMPDQRVRPEELVHPKREGPPATFKVSDQDVLDFQGAWFATVKGLSLDSDSARHALVAQWTADEWPKAKRTDSLPTMRRRMTVMEAADFLAHVRAICEDERRELLAFTDETQEGGRSGDDVRDAARLTGAVVDADEQTTAF